MEKENGKNEAEIPAKQAIAGKIEQDMFAPLAAEKKELVDSLQRLQAEFENFRKRVEKEKLQCVCFGKAEAVFSLLAVLDSFDAAGEKLKKEKKEDSGLELLHKQFLQSLEKLGLKEINALGKQFSHENMDCMMQGSDNSKEDGIVLEEFQKGYVLDGIVLRHAKVKVNRRIANDKEKVFDAKEITEKK